VIRLFRAPFSTNCERIGLAIGQKGAEIESVVIDYEDRSPVVAVSGQELVPVIVDEDEVVAGSVPVLRHLERRFPEPPLFPLDPARLAELNIFCAWFDEVWKRPANEIEREMGMPSADEAEIARLGAVLLASLESFEELLAGRDFLWGERFSAVDCVAYPFLKYALRRDPDDDELFHLILEQHQSVAGRPRLAAWIRRVGEFPVSYGETVGL
jgi:glutathione S-transferase